eukprot:6347709-Pyramimonas_sp.AAC.1
MLLLPRQHDPEYYQVPRLDVVLHVVSPVWQRDLGRCRRGVTIVFPREPAEPIHGLAFVSVVATG